MLGQNVRFSLRLLAKNPSFTLVAVLVLALGIGANSAMFSVLNEFLLRPVPGARNSEGLVALCCTEDGAGCHGFSHPEYLDLRDQSHVFSGLIAYQGTPLNLSAHAGEPAERVSGALVSGNYFTVLGVNTRLGRTFLPEEDRTPGTHPVAVLSCRLWERRFESDPGLVGKTIGINGTAFTVIGIAPEGFRGTEVGEWVDVWIPVMMEQQARPMFGGLGRMFNPLNMAGRLRDEVGLEQAQAEMNTIAPRLFQLSERRSKRLGVRLVPGIRLDPGWRNATRDYLLLLMGIAAFVLLIACANVANLLLAKAAARRREIAVRLAVGANRRNLIRQLLTESLLLALVSSGAAFVLALWTSKVLNVLYRRDQLDFTPDWRVLGFTLLLSLPAAILFGLAPAWQACEIDLVPALKGAAAGDSSRRWRLRNWLVVAQVALSLVLLVGAGLCVRTLTKLQAVDPGFDVGNILMMRIDLRLQGYSRAKGQLFYKQLQERIPASILARSAPLSGWNWGHTVRLPGGPETKVDSNVVSPGYLEMLNIPILRGRSFNSADKEGTVPVAIVNQTMARKLWPGEDPIGKRIQMVHGANVQVIGVAKDTRYRGLRDAPRAHLYLPLAQDYDPAVLLLVRAAGDPKGVLPALRRELENLDKDLPVFEIRTLREHMAESLSWERDNAAIVSIFGLLAVVLASTGLYAVMSYAVSQRVHEIGIRMALGAHPADVLKIVISEGMGMTGIGIGIGFLAALGLTRVLSGWLYGVSAADPITFAGVAVLLGGIAMTACWLPARKATRIDPLLALRCE